MKIRNALKLVLTLAVVCIPLGQGVVVCTDDAGNQVTCFLVNGMAVCS